MPVETRYFRSDTQTVNGLTAYILGTAESSSLKELEIGADQTVYIGIRVWKRNSAGSETEITSGSAVAIASLGYGSTLTTTRSATWDCPGLDPMDAADAIVVRVYGDVDVTPPTTLMAAFVTGQLGASKLDAATWTVYYRIRRLRSGVSPDFFYIFYFRFGKAGDDSYITNFTWTPAPVVKKPIMKMDLGGLAIWVLPYQLFLSLAYFGFLGTCGVFVCSVYGILLVSRIACEYF